MRNARLWATGSALCLATTVSACRPDDQRTDSVDAAAAGTMLAPSVVAQLDSGNTAYRAREMDRAVVHYRRAIELAPEAAAAWFGVYLAESARGDTAQARAALERARALAPGASLLRTDEPPPR